MLSYQQDESENERDGVDGEEEDLGDTENKNKKNSSDVKKYNQNWAWLWSLNTLWISSYNFHNFDTLSSKN